MSDEPYYLRSGSHVLITGATGAGPDYGGKTALANWWFSESVRHHAHPEIGVFFNAKGHTWIRGKTVRSLSEMKEYLANGVRVFNVIPDDAETAHAHVVDFLRRVRGSKIMVHDEAHQYDGSDLMEWSLRQGGNVADSERWATGNIQSLVVTQHPWDAGQKVVQNCPLKVWVGPMTQEASRYFETMKTTDALADVREQTGPYRWSVMDAGEYVETNPPVPPRFAGE